MRGGPSALPNSISDFRVERQMPWLSFIASPVVSLLRGAVSAVVTLLSSSWDYLFGWSKTGSPLTCGFPDFGVDAVELVVCGRAGGTH
jgi:hypothetical protein